MDGLSWGPDSIDLSGSAEWPVRCAEIRSLAGDIRRRVLQGRTARGRYLTIVEAVTPGEQAEPIACRLMEAEEAWRFDAWCGTTHLHRPRGIDSPATRPQWPTGGVTPQFASVDDEAAFWLAWAFDDLMDASGHALQSVAGDARTNATS